MARAHLRLADHIASLHPDYCEMKRRWGMANLRRLYIKVIVCVTSCVLLNDKLITNIKRDKFMSYNGSHRESLIRMVGYP